MSEMLLKHFDLLATAPDGVSLLRELILTLAVQGKLVPQDPNDEPASELLKRIRAEKDRLIAEGKIKHDKSLTPITDEEKPFDVPQGWKWVRLGELCSYIQRGKGPVYAEDSAHRVVSQKCVRWYGLDLGPARFITAESLNKYESIRFLRSGDLLWNSTGTGTIGRACLVPQELDSAGLVADSHVTVVRPMLLDGQFLWRWIQSPYVQDEIEGSASGTTNQIELNTSTVINHLVPLAPLEEHARIVARVEELMRLCDALEAKRQLDAMQHAQLLHTLLGTLTDSATPEELAVHWQRVAAHFDLLLDRPEAVDALEQTILQLAVRGLLVPQDPTDEPASVLLQRIRAEKDRLIADGKIKRVKPLPPISDDEQPFALPLGWELVSVATVFDTTSGNTVELGMEKEAGAYMYVKVGDMNLTGNEYEITTSSRFIDPDEKMVKALIPSGSIIFPKRGGAIATNKKRVINTPIFVDLNTMAITPVLVLTEYALLWLKTIDLASLNTGTSVPQINHKDIDPLPFPLPPLAEQSRIVARSEELSQICNDLRQLLSNCRSTQAHLAQMLTGDMVAS